MKVEMKVVQMVQKWAGMKADMKVVKRADLMAN